MKKIGKRIGEWVELYKEQDAPHYRMFNKMLLSRLQKKGTPLTPERMKDLMKKMGPEWFSTYIPQGEEQ